MATRVRHARSPLVGGNGLLTLLAVYLLLLGLVGQYARQSAASGTLGLVGFLMAFLGTLLLAGYWWLEAFAVSYAAAKAPALVAETPTRRLLAGAVVSFGVFALGWVLFGVASVRARGFPRDAALLLVVGGGIGFADRGRFRRRWRWRWRGWAPGCCGRILAAKSSWSLHGDAEPAGCCRPWRDRDRDRNRSRRPAGCLHALLRARPRAR